MAKQGDPDSGNKQSLKKVINGQILTTFLFTGTSAMGINRLFSILFVGVNNHKAMRLLCPISACFSSAIPDFSYRSSDPTPGFA